MVSGWCRREYESVIAKMESKHRQQVHELEVSYRAYMYKLPSPLNPHSVCPGWL